MSEWRDYLNTLNEHDRAIARAIFQHVLARVSSELQQAGVRSKLNADRVSEAHLRIDATNDRVHTIDQTIDDILATLAQLALGAETRQAQCERQVNGDGNG